MVWYSHLLQNFPQFIVIHTVKGFGIVNKAEIGFGIVNKAEIDVFLKLSCFIDYAKAFKMWKILKEMGIPDHLTCLLRNLYAVRKQQLELAMEQQTGSK